VTGNAAQFGFYEKPGLDFGMGGRNAIGAQYFFGKPAQFLGRHQHGCDFLQKVVVKKDRWSVRPLQFVQPVAQ